MQPFPNVQLTSLKELFHWQMYTVNLQIVSTFVTGAGMDKVRERGATLPGNDKENWGNHHIDVIGYEEEEEKREKGEKEEERKGGEKR